MKKASIKIILLTILVSITTYAQELPKVTPPSPEVTQLTKFIETPVNYSNGLPTISIPIYTIAQDGISIPITLDYHARGVRVDEVASNVGLGWALNGVGIISRQVRGLPDEQGLLGSQGLEVINGLQSETIRRQIFANQSYGYPFDYYTPDQFFYSFPGGSGKFIFDYKDKKPVIQNQSNGIKLESNLVGDFRIIDNKGNKYIFGADNRTSKEGTLQDIVARHNEGLSIEITNGSGSDIKSGWYLTDIETSNNSLIQFKYIQSSNIYYKRSYDKRETNGTIASYFSKNIADENVIEQIVFKNGKIVFEYDPNPDGREDINYGKKLEWIKVYDDKDILIKKVKLNYFYSNNTSSQNVLPYLYNVDPYARKRMFLESVDEINLNDENDKISYSMEYDFSSPMPNRHSNSKDIWGYYNGANNGHIILPLQSLTGDRRTNSELSGVGLLKKINYPTGGYAKYTYEDNIVNRNNKIDEVILEGGYPNPVRDIIIGLSPFESATYYNGNMYIKPFTVSEKSKKFKYNLWFTDNVTCQTGYEADCKFLVSIRSVNPIPIGTNFSSIVIENGLRYISYKLTPGTNNIYQLPPGEYNIKVEPLFSNYNPLDPNNFFNLIFQWEEEIKMIEGNINYFFAGGKRIKKIEKYNDDYNLAFQKEYEYKTDEGSFSGNLNGLPDFYAIKKRVNINGTIANVVENYGSGHGSPISSFQGNSVTYNQVTEYIGNKNNNIGKSIYTFTDLEDTGDYWIFPYNIPTDNEWLRGLLLKERHYSFLNQQYQIKKQIENKYVYGFRDSEYNIDAPPGSDLAQMNEADYTGFPTVYTIPISKNITDNKYKYKKENGFYRIPYFVTVVSLVDSPNLNVNKYWTEETFPPTSDDLVTTDGNPYYFYYKTFFMTGGFVGIGKTTTTDYFDTGNVITVTKFKYENDLHKQLTEQITTHESNSVLKTTYNYAQDVNDQMLIGKNLTGIPLITETEKNGEKLSTQETVYKNWGNNLLAPEIVKTAKGNQPLEDRIKYNVLDNTNGNPLEIEQVDGIKIVYIWGYNKTQPIAKIENATYASIPFSTINNLQNMSNTGTEANLIAALNALRVSLPNAMVTTYTYKTLIGISTVTDPKGNIQTYYYDGFNRLQFVKDAQGNIISKNEYHYKN